MEVCSWWMERRKPAVASYLPEHIQGSAARPHAHYPLQACVHLHRALDVFMLCSTAADLAPSVNEACEECCTAVSSLLLGDDGGVLHPACVVFDHISSHISSLLLSSGGYLGTSSRDTTDTSSSARY